MDIKLQIYKFLQTIPHGKVVSYKTIADKFNIHPRYVGKIYSIAKRTSETKFFWMIDLYGPSAETLSMNEVK